MISYFHQKLPQPVEVGIIIWKFSRFGRNFDDSQFYRADLRRLGYEVFSMNDTIPTGSTGRVIETMLDWMNQRFLEDLSTDVKRGLHHLIKTHGALGGVPPRGFKREYIEIGKRRNGQPHIVPRWVPDEELWPICQLAWEMRAAGRSYKDIHKETHLFNSSGSYTTFFKNRLYLGELHFGELVFENYAPAMVDDLTWARVQEINTASNLENDPTQINKSHPSRIHSPYLFTGLAVCSVCGSPLNGHTIKFKSGYRREYYRCSGSNRKLDDHASDIPRLELEERVLLDLRDHVVDYNTLAIQNITIADDNNEFLNKVRESEKQFQKLITSAKKRKDNLLYAMSVSPQLISSITEAIEKIDAEISGYEVELLKLDQNHSIISNKPTNQDIQDVSRYLTEAITHGNDDPESLKRILRGMIRKISVLRTGKEIKTSTEYKNPVLAFMFEDCAPKVVSWAPINEEPFTYSRHLSFHLSRKKRTPKPSSGVPHCK